MGFFEKVGETVLEVGETVISILDSLNTESDEISHAPIHKKSDTNLKLNGGTIMGLRFASTVLALGVALATTVATSVANNAKKTKKIKKMQEEKDQISTENSELKKENDLFREKEKQAAEEQARIENENIELKKENDLYKEREKQAAEEQARIENEKTQIENFGLDDMIDTDIMEIINEQ